MAMWPASSVSGYYFASRKQVFRTGENKEDQVIDYAKRRSISTDKAMKWLGPNI
jgi:5-methyltetrahydrofolate--homocysteine methyltransferase